MRELPTGWRHAARVFAAALAAAFLGSPASAAPEQAVVSTDGGPVRGIVTPSLRKFLGIPYAAPPVGNLRWRPPQAPARWHAPRDATTFGPHCAQPASAFGLPSTSEDCLYLNVYTPANIDHGVPHRRPVMVWIHGGALFLGESDDYDPTALVETGDVIVVTINYRLGALGFLAHPALSAESRSRASGNYGLMDQQMALTWVQRNIAHFGGDPDNVTIFGESAGGLSVHSQLASPRAAGLFHRAITQSGAYSLAQPTLAAAEAQGTDLAARAGCAEPTADCLRALPVDALLVAQGALGFVPNLDGGLMPRTVQEAFVTGQFNHVPVIEGSNHDEWRLQVALFHDLFGGPVTPAGYPAAVAGTLFVFGLPTAWVSSIVAQYPLANYASPDLALGAVGTDGVFACNARTSARLLSQYVPTFVYEFNDANAPQIFLPPVSYPYGAYHAAELQYLFGVRPSVPAAPLNAGQKQLSRAMVRYWTQFARTGDPNPAHAPFWPRYGTGAELVQSFAPPTPATETGFAVDHRCAFWDALGG